MEKLNSVDLSPRHEMIFIQMLCMENTSEMKKIYDGR